MADTDDKPTPRPLPPAPELPPVRCAPRAGLGNWFWRKFVAPFFGG